VALLLSCSVVSGQSTSSLISIRSVYVDSFGDQPGASELRDQLIDVLRHSGKLQVTPLKNADAVLGGMGAIWIRGYHSLSPRARVNDVYAEPIYGGYLSVILKGKQGQILWSYFVNPTRASFGENLKHNLATQLVDRLTEAIAGETVAVPVPTDASNTPVTVQGAGATFPFPIYTEWFTSFRASNPNVLLVYDPIGSEEGFKQLIAERLDFVGSDVPVGAFEDLKPHSRLLAFPSVIGAVVLIYNLPRFGGDLRLNARTLVSMLDGHIKNWNDPAIRALNHGSSLPNRPIQVVHRSDGSGTTFALTEYLCKVSETWKHNIGQGPRVPWPVGVGANGNDGVSKVVEETPYSLGYTEFIYAFRRRLSFASIENAAGEFIEADLPSIAAAANYRTNPISEDFAISLSNATGHGSYPISTFTWLVMPAQSTDPLKGRALRQFLQWMLVAGQKQCMALGYAPLPRSIAEQEQKVVQELK